MSSLLPLFALPAFYLIGLGVYRPYKYGLAARRHLGLVPVALFVLMFVGIQTGAALAGKAQSGNGDVSGSVAVLETSLIFFVLAVAAGAMNAWMFRPAQGSR